MPSPTVLVSGKGEGPAALIDPVAQITVQPPHTRAWGYPAPRAGDGLLIRFLSGSRPHPVRPPH